MSDKIFEANSPLGYKVCCFKSDWENHIASGHTIMSSNIEAVQYAVENPDAVYQSNQWPRRDVYFARYTGASYGGKLYTKVIVQTPDIDDDSGYVVSAWPQPDIKGNIDKGGPKYVKPKL